VVKWVRASSYSLAISKILEELSPVLAIFSLVSFNFYQRQKLKETKEKLTESPPTSQKIAILTHLSNFARTYAS
jgi:hypothetical protein